MSRILLVSTSTTVGGAEKTLYTLATLLDPRKFTLAGVVSLKPEGEYARRLAASGIKVETLGLSKPRPSDAERLAALIRRERPDLVHALMFSAIQLTRLAKPKVGFPFKLVSSPRVSYRTRPAWTLALDRWLKDRDDLLVAESQSSADYLTGRLGYAKEKVAVIRNGVDVAGWPASKVDRAKRRLELRLGGSDLLIGAVGRLDEQKGFAYLIEAMASLKSLPVRCAVLGEGPERPKLEALIRKHALEKSVWLLGEQKEMPSWLSAFDAFCLPSLWEGLPNSLLEAMAFGLPAVATSVDGVPEVVRHGATGLLVPPEDPKALSDAFRKLVMDPAMRERLGESAKKEIAEKFTLRRMMSEYEDLYQRVVAGG